MDDDFELIELGASAFSVASTQATRREAQITWLRGAVAHAELVAPGAGVPGQQLIAALEALNAGMAPTLFDGQERTPAELDAMARAVAATIAFGAEGKRMGVKKGAMTQARALVCHFNGMRTSNLESLCGHVGAGLKHLEDGNYSPSQRYLSVVQRVPMIRQEWKERQDFAATWGISFNLYEAICTDLRNDREILTQF